MSFKLLLLLSFLIINIINAKDIRIVPPQSNFDSSHDYFYTLLEKILDSDIKKYGKSKIIFSVKMQQGRALIQLQNNEDIDVYWAGTSNIREKNLRAIKIPLLKGLLGYRVLVINKKNKKLFDNIKNIEELKELNACQGKHWPDTEILENSDFKVVKNPNYEAMFLQVLHQRCDYFPRGIHEGYSEVEARKKKFNDLMLYDRIIIYYPFPMYFFVSKKNEKLAQRIEEGLLTLINNGSFDKNLEEHSITKYLFPIKNWESNKIYKIPNPLLPKSTDYKNKKFWILSN